MSKPPPATRRTAPLALLAAAGAVGAPFSAQAAVAPERAAMQARVSAVREALAQTVPLQGATAPAAPGLVAQAVTWTNWPKWSKWSNWANK